MFQKLKLHLLCGGNFQHFTNKLQNIWKKNSNFTSITKMLYSHIYYYKHIFFCASRFLWMLLSLFIIGTDTLDNFIDPDLGKSNLAWLATQSLIEYWIIYAPVSSRENQTIDKHIIENILVDNFTITKRIWFSKSQTLRKIKTVKNLWYFWNLFFK